MKNPLYCEEEALSINKLIALIEQYDLICLVKVEFVVTNELKLEGIVGFVKRKSHAPTEQAQK